MLTTPPATPPAAIRARGRRGRRAASLAATAVTAVTAAGLLASCASASTSQAASTTHDAATSGHPAPGAPMSTASSQGTGALATCRSASLRITVDVSQAGGAAGSTYYPVDFTNTSASACGMYGYPGVSFVTAGDDAGRQLGAAAQRNPQFGKQTVRLVAGGVAHAWLQVAEAGNYPASMCQPVTAHWLRVFAPGDTAAIYVNQSFPACSSASTPLLTVMPIRADRGVRGTTP